MTQVRTMAIIINHARGVARTGRWCYLMASNSVQLVEPSETTVSRPLDPVFPVDRSLMAWDCAASAPRLKRVVHIPGKWQLHCGTLQSSGLTG